MVIFKSNKYIIKENEINDAGYQFLQTDKIAEAIEFFKINVETFPKSGNAYDSLGEAYLKTGNKKLAIENYKKSIELDPQKSAAYILQTLTRWGYIE